MKRICLLIALLVPLSVHGQGVGTSQRGAFRAAIVAFGSVTASYTTFLVNSGSRNYKALDILNVTDQPIWCSVDAATDQFYVPAYSNLQINLADVGLGTGAIISCKRVSAAPTVGSVVIQASFADNPV